MTERQPWAERTVELGSEQESGFRRGRASVSPRTARTETFPAEPHQSTGTGWPQAEPAPRLPVDHQLRQLRRGSGWSVMGGLFAFVCWGIWALSAGGDLTSPAVTFVLTSLVALGLFLLARLVGRVVLERHLGRVRRSARGAHLVTGLFLVGVGVAYLRQTEWIVDAWNWLTNR